MASLSEDSVLELYKSILNEENLDSIQSSNEPLSQFFVAQEQEKRKLKKSLQRLQEHLESLEAEHTNDLLELQKQISELEQKSDHYDAYEENESLIRQIRALEETIKQGKKEKKEELIRRQELEEKVENLHLIIESFELSKKQDLEFSTSQLKSEIKQLHFQLDSEKEKVLTLEKELEKIKSEKETKTEAKEDSKPKEPLSPLLAMIPQNGIDPKIISNLLLRYFKANDEKAKSEILLIITKVLEMSDDEKKQLGFRKINGNWEYNKEEEIDLEQSLADEWISYLLKEAKS